MRHFTTVLLIILISELAYSQSVGFNNAINLGGSSNDGGSSIEIDALGNVYTTGSFKDSVDFDPSSGVYTLISNGENDGFIQKIDSEGNFLWAIQIGGLLKDYANQLSIDSNGDLVVVGQFEGSVYIGTDTLTSIAGKDAFILKLSNSGEIIWAKSIGSSQNFLPRLKLACDNLSNIYVSSTYRGSVDCDPNEGEHFINSLGIGSTDIFIIKLDNDGNYLWSHSYGGSTPLDEENGDFGEEVYAIEIDVNNNVYVVGLFIGSFSFYPGNTDSNVSSNGHWDIFILKIDSDGDYIWVKDIGGSFVDWPQDIAIDNIGNIYVTGSYFYTVDFDPGPDVFNVNGPGGSEEPFLLKLNSNGEFIWVKEIGAGYGTGWKVLVDNEQNIYYKGYYNSISDLDPGLNSYYIDSPKNVISKLDSNGSFIWAKDLLTLDSPSNLSDFCLSGNMDLYFTGSFEGTYDFNPNSPEYNLTSNGATDAFIFSVEQTPLGIMDNNILPFDVSLSPNPTNGLLNIHLAYYGLINVEVYTIQGRMIDSIDNLLGPSFQIKINEAPGMYIVKLLTDSQAQSFKIFKH